MSEGFDFKDPIIDVGQSGERYVFTGGGRTYRTGLAREVREYLGGLPRGLWFTAPDVAGVLLEPTPRVRDVFRDMLRRGEIERLGPQRYRYLGSGMVGERTGQIRPRVLRAMHTKGIFCVREISVLADVKKNTIRKIVRRLIEAGDLDQLGKQRTPRGDVEHLYGVRNYDGFFLKYVCSSEWRKRQHGRKKKEKDA